MRGFRYIFFCIILLISCQPRVLGQSRIDSLRALLEKSNLPDSIIVNNAIEICKAVVNTDQEILLPHYALVGLTVDTVGKYFRSKFVLYELLGNYYWQAGKLSEAGEQFNKMRLIGETKKDSNIIANSYNGLGTVYYLLKSNNEALDYYKKALSLAGTDTMLKVHVYNNIGNTYTSIGQLDSVLQYYDKSITYHLAHQNFRYLSIVYSNKALVYQKLKNDEELKKNLNLSLDAAKKANDPYQTASVYSMLGSVVSDQHPELAEEYLNEALRLARQYYNFDQIIQILDYLTYITERKGNYKKANDYLHEIKTLDDSLDLAQRKSRVQQLEYEYKAELKKFKDIEQETQTIRKMDREKNRQRALLIVVSIALIALLFIFVMGFQMYRLRMKISATKDRFFSMIAHDIRSPFSGILGLSSLLYEESVNHPDPLHRKQAESLHKSLTNVYDLLDNLLQWSQSETGKVAFKPQFQIINPIVEEVIYLHEASAKQKNLTIHNEVQYGLTARFDANMLHTILRNLLSNAIKFSPDNSAIFISAKTEGKEVTIAVTDQGIGMSADHLEKIFNSDKGISTLGTRNESGTGLGLILCKNFVTLHGGKIQVESKPREGTTISFTLPD